ncbi:MAG: HD domain-containing protein [Chloroflexi bacterium]|nr:HD domain-containing protein [Chloroflexota bacterium]
MRLSPRFDEALVYAAQLHRGQMRKSTQGRERRIPYIAHLLAVSSLALENGGDEDAAIAALLHDAVEDQGGREVLEEIRRRFGDHVAMIVDGCTDAYTIPKPPWKGRKEAYLARLVNEPPEVRLVSLADKVHNARGILDDLRNEGVMSLDRFNGGREGTLWYYNALAAIFSEGEGTIPLADEFVRVVTEINRLVGYPAG